MLDKLSAPFPPESVHWRIGSTTADKKRGMALAYLDARDVMERLDGAVGPANWQDRYEMHGTRTLCFLSLRIDGEWITKSDGAGDTDVEAEKGSISDAFKRAAVKWGVGRYLYDVEAPWVEVDSYERNGKTYVRGIKDSEKRKLVALLGRQLVTAPDPKRDPLDLPERDAAPQPDEPRAELSKAEYARECLEIIDGATDATTLKQWWDGQKNARVRYRFTQEDVDALREKVLAKIQELGVPQADTVVAADALADMVVEPQA